MTKTFTLPKRGQVYTSPMNAGSLEPGDVIVKDDQWTVIDTVSAPISDNPRGLVVHLEGKMSGQPWGIITPINRPMNRVVGARSAGQIN